MIGNAIGPSQDPELCSCGHRLTRDAPGDAPVEWLAPTRTRAWRRRCARDVSQGLSELGYDLVSTGGTAKALREAGLEVRSGAAVAVGRRLGSLAHVSGLWSRGDGTADCLQCESISERSGPQPERVHQALSRLARGSGIF